MTDDMRENFKLMQCVATYTRHNPKNRIEKLLSFNKRLQNTPNVVTEFTEWNLELDKKLLDIPGRLLNNEVLTFGGNATITSIKGDWTQEMQNKRCLVVKPLKDWILLVTERDRHLIQVSHLYSFKYYDIFLCVIYISTYISTYFIRKKYPNQKIVFQFLK